MTPTNKQLISELPTTHAIFERDQVLTACQLNSILEYVEPRCQKTRTRLIGIGRLCGLDLKEDTDGNLIIEPGCGITSHGHLITFSTRMVFDRIAPFKDENAHYGFFQSDNVTIDSMWELIHKNADDESEFPQYKKIKDLTSAEYEDLVVVLYCEIYEHDPDICTGGECDNKGIEYHNNLKALLVPLSHAEENLYTWGTMLPREMDLRVFDIKRVIVDNDIEQFDDLYLRYTTAADSSHLVEKLLTSESNTSLRKTLELSYARCQENNRNWLGPAYYGISPVSGWKTKFTEIWNTLKSNQEVRKNIQYVYDFLRDVVQAYNEFRDIAYEIAEDKSFCCPSADSFPKHLVLGQISMIDNPEEDYLRQDFIPSPLHTTKEDELIKLRFYHLRIDSMINSFTIPAPSGTIKITPSRAPDEMLGLKAIPFYYEISSTNPESGINKYWNLEYTKNGRDVKIYSYNADKYAPVASAALDPLSYDFSRFPFFRIEGHLGLDVDTVYTSLTSMIEDNNLPFSVHTIQIDKQTTEVSNGRVHMPGVYLRHHELSRKELLYKLDYVKLFGETVRKTVKDEERLPSNEPEKPGGMTQEDINNDLDALDNQVAIAAAELRKNQAQFDYEAFDLSMNQVKSLAAGLNCSLNGITYNSVFTPYELIANELQHPKLKWLDSIIKEKEEEAKEQTTLAGFDQTHLLTHLGGVNWGGTFVLVFSKDDNKIVADFTLSHKYCGYVMEEAEDDEITDSDDTANWESNNTYEIYIPSVEVLEAEIAETKQKVDEGLLQWEEFRIDIEEKIANIPTDDHIQELIEPLIPKDIYILELIEPRIQEYYELVELTKRTFEEAYNHIYETHTVTNELIKEGNAEILITKQRVDEVERYINSGELQDEVLNAVLGDIEDLKNQYQEYDNRNRDLDIYVRTSLDNMSAQVNEKMDGYNNRIIEAETSIKGLQGFGINEVNELINTQMNSVYSAMDTYKGMTESYANQFNDFMRENYIFKTELAGGGFQPAVEFENEKLNWGKGMLEGMAREIENIERKEQKGMASEKEIERKDKLDEANYNTIITYCQDYSFGTKDIKKGGEDEKYISFLAENAKKIRSTGRKSALSRKISSFKTLATTKGFKNLASAFDVF